MTEKGIIYKDLQIMAEEKKDQEKKIIEEARRRLRQLQAPYIMEYEVESGADDQ